LNYIGDYEMYWREIKGFQKGIVSTELVAIGREADGTIRDAQNVRVKSGSVVTRTGHELYIDFSISVPFDNQILGQPFEYRRESYNGVTTTIWRVIVFTTRTKLYYCQPEISTHIAVQITGHPQSNNDFHYVNIYDSLWLMNGVDEMYVWDGNNIWRAGIPKPLKPKPIITRNGPAGIYSARYKFTYYSSGAPYILESNPTDYGEVTLVNIAPTTNINNNVSYVKVAGEVVDDKVDYVRIYRTVFWDPATDDPGIYYLLEDRTLAEANAEGWQYDDKISDDVLITHQEYDVTDRGLPPKARYGLWHDNRLFCAGDYDNPSILSYSAPGKPFYFPDESYDEINRDDGDIITGLGSIGPTRYIFKNRSIFEWTGNPETATPIRQVERLDSTQNMNRVTVGCRYPNTLAGWNNSLVFRTENGDVYMLTQESLRNLTEFYNGVRTIGLDCFGAIKDDYYIIGDLNKSYICYLPTGAWESMDTTVFTHPLIRYNNDLLATTRWLGVPADPDDPQSQDLYYCGFNRLYIEGLTTDFGNVLVKHFQTKYIKLIDGDSDTAVIRRIKISCTTEVPFIVRVYNEKGESTFGVYDIITKQFSVPSGIRLRGKYISVELTWTGDTEVFGLSIGFLKGAKH
jgi:hypothetical protein